jgi:hypothetical protein
MGTVIRMNSKKMIGTLRLLCLLGTFALAATALAGQLPPPLAADAQSAVVNGDRIPAEGGFLGTPAGGVQIWMIDGENIGKGLLKGKYPYSVRLTPGRHTLRAMLKQGRTTYFSQFWVDAEAGRNYTAKFGAGSYGPVMWLADDATGTRVGGLGDGQREGDSPLPGTTPSAQITLPESREMSGTKARNPPPPPGANSAVLVCDPGNGKTAMGLSLYVPVLERTQILLLDGVKQYHPGNIFQVFTLAPGKHSIVVRDQYGNASFLARLEFAAQAGKRYWIRRHTEAYAVTMWIAEEGSTDTVSTELPVDDPYRY